jgi:hypothetical protein
MNLLKKLFGGKDKSLFNFTLGSFECHVTIYGQPTSLNSIQKDQMTTAIKTAFSHALEAHIKEGSGL